MAKSRYFVIGLLTVVVMTGCTAPGDWDVADRRLDPRAKDFARCRYEAKKAVASVGGDTNFDSLGSAVASGIGDAIQMSVREDWLIRECMREAGYTNNG